MCGYPASFDWTFSAVKGRMPRELLSRRPHTHHALDDAVEQAELMSNLMLWQPPRPWNSRSDPVRSGL
ncbi:hypothetical protein AB0B01_00490 [Streptomyces sp. NPDC044571]|uniref:hypothetical protein n=1 Tax=Streptomyces sp. NPDC044571 TaxID=3155371 RepID=UPI0033C021F4